MASTTNSSIVTRRERLIGLLPVLAPFAFYLTVAAAVALSGGN